MTAPAITTDAVTIHLGNCLDILREMPDASVDSIVTDPPYGMSNTDPARVIEALTHWATDDRDFVPTGRGFMGKSWDAFVPPPAVWDECMRVLKPGGHLLAFAGSRTFDLMTLSIRFAGFDIRDGIAWLYGSGFPKSLDVSKAIDKAAGATREVLSSYERSGRSGGILGTPTEIVRDVTAPATPAAEQWQGWGTALKPAFEPIVVARKPLIGTVAANVLAHGTGALNIDGTRVATSEDRSRPPRTPNAILGGGKGTNLTASESNPAGRWPANVVMDGDAADALDEQSKTSVSRVGKPRGAAAGDGWGMTATGAEYADAGGPSRFFPTFRYQAKAPTRERPTVTAEDGTKTAHLTVKPLTLMRWLVRLVTPPGGVVLDPFVGSGTTVEAAALEGFQAIGIEGEADYLPLIQQRLDRLPTE